MILWEGTLSRLGKAADHERNVFTYRSSGARETTRRRGRDGLASMRPATGRAVLDVRPSLMAGGKEAGGEEAGTIEDGDGKGLVKYFPG